MVKRIPERPTKTREELEAEHGRVWSTPQLAAEFIITSIIVPNIVVVRRKWDGTVGQMKYQNLPRYFFCFDPQPHSP